MREEGDERKKVLEMFFIKAGFLISPKLLPYSSILALSSAINGNKSYEEKGERKRGEDV